MTGELSLILLVLYPCSILPASEDPRSDPDRVDPWDVVTDYDFSSSRVAQESQLHILDRTLRLAQKDMKYFHEEVPLWERPDPGHDHMTGYDFEKWNKTFIRAPKGFGDKQTLELMKKMMIPEFDITKIKLKPDRKNNASVVFGVVVKEGPENKIIGYSSKRLHVQIHAPSYQGAVDNELARFLSKVLSIPRKMLKIKQGAGQYIRKVRMPRTSIQENLYIKKMLKEFALDRVTEKIFDA